MIYLILNRYRYDSPVIVALHKGEENTLFNPTKSSLFVTVQVLDKLASVQLSHLPQPDLGMFLPFFNSALLLGEI